MAVGRVVVDECTSYEHNDLHITICTSKTKIFVTIASKSFALHILPKVESLWATLGDRSREVYWNHEKGTVTIIDYAHDSDFDKLNELDENTYRSDDKKVREILREFEEIANDLLDRAAVLVAFSDLEQ